MPGRKTPSKHPGDGSDSGPCARRDPRRRGQRRGGRKASSTARGRGWGRVVRARIPLHVSRGRACRPRAARPFAAPSPPPPLARAGGPDPSAAFSSESAPPQPARAPPALGGRSPVSGRATRASPSGRRSAAACPFRPASARQRRMACSSAWPPARPSSPLTLVLKRAAPARRTCARGASDNARKRSEVLPEEPGDRADPGLQEVPAEDCTLRVQAAKRSRIRAGRRSSRGECPNTSL